LTSKLRLQLLQVPPARLPLHPWPPMSRRQRRQPLHPPQARAARVLLPQLPLPPAGWLPPPPLLQPLQASGR
jgi:hypothetical protein